jgi:hypothetical protein
MARRSSSRTVPIQTRAQKGGGGGKGSEWDEPGGGAFPFGECRDRKARRGHAHRLTQGGRRANTTPPAGIPTTASQGSRTT